jgi:hypothetical protein
VVISAATYHLVEGLFACEDRGRPRALGARYCSLQSPTAQPPCLPYPTRPRSRLSNLYSLAVMASWLSRPGPEEKL